MHMLQSLFYLTVALYVSGIIITDFQKHKTTVTTGSGNRYTVTYGVTVTRCCSYSCFVLLKMGDNDTRNMYNNRQIN